jgi:serine phosphatase RsbU (regulator of sigma subunit)
VTFLDVLPPSPPLGLFGYSDGWCESTTFPLRPGDRLLFYTDGVTEARDAKGRFFALPERVAALHQEPPTVLMDCLTAELRRHTGHQPRDDAALLLVQYAPVRHSASGHIAEADHETT